MNDVVKQFSSSNYCKFTSFLMKVSAKKENGDFIAVVGIGNPKFYGIDVFMCSLFSDNVCVYYICYLFTMTC